MFKTFCLKHVRALTQSQSVGRRIGRPRKFDDVFVFDHIQYVLKTGCQWSALVVPGGSYKTIWAYFNRWSKNHVFERAFDDCVKAYKTACPKGRRARNRNGVVGRNPTDRGRKATKVSLLTDGHGTPLSMCFHRANRHDSKTLGHTLRRAEARIGIRGWLRSVYADKGYDASSCREICESFGCTPIITRRGNHTQKRENATRVVVEHTGVQHVKPTRK